MALRDTLQACWHKLIAAVTPVFIMGCLLSQNGVIRVHLTSKQLLNIFHNNCGNVKCTVIAQLCDNRTPHYENGNHGYCWRHCINALMNLMSIQLMEINCLK